MLVILIEEQVLEQIFYPNSRGKSFPGIIPSLLDVLPPIIILSAFKFANDAFRKQRELEILRATVQESELQFLKSQINPHFLFNNLNNLYSYALENSPKTPTIILELSDVLRYMLYDCKSDYVSLKKEIKQLENFTKLSELQIEDRGKIRYSANNISDQYQIAPLILIVFIENAFKHSQASLSSNISIDIEISLSGEGILSFSCANNYQPTGNNENLAHGIGLQNVQKRLNILYPDMHKLKIDKSQNNYTVNLTMYLDKNQGVN